ncbi:MULTISPECIES: DUF2062 domain-containing protein [unclassified Lentimonas]|uniref:DUF2062 domain-containing protein n=1 Tax=unclassified Lentimonas TaxID=2630993 RepID=UPI001329847A|nr:MULTISPECIES: DUF2062 domain-containing protein [unclassified Lentimonas]CAA6690378.1 Unannotated [Lentimonas sp. CC19]CAA6693926.1 Unannotated [Lentimonas sp. CC10]CAA7068585.1 Unannotated [Lentimonas sp. CC11]
MTIEEHELRETRSRRIRRVKRWLRPLPRRSNIHRYPILSHFAEFSRKRIYLWSFRVDNVVPALYAGFILALMPLYGIQIGLALCFALLLRANLPTLVGLQMISNPLTILPFWYAAYQVGHNVLSIVSIETAPMNRSEIRSILHNFTADTWSSNLELVLSAFLVMCLGGIVMGTFFGLISSFAYRIAARRTAASYALLVQKIQDRKARKSDSPTNDSPHV